MLLFMEGFDGVNSVAQLARRGVLTVGNVGIWTTGGRFGGGAIQAYAGEARTYVPLSNVSGDTLHIGFAWGLQTRSINQMRFSLGRGYNMPVSGGGIYTCFNLYQDNGPSVSVYDADNTKIGSFMIPLDGLWHWWDITCVAKTAANGGSLTIRRDGDVVFSATNVKMAGSSAIGSKWVWGWGHWYGASYGDVGYMDDLVICDTAGSLNNGVIGDCRIVTQKPNALDTAGGFVANTGTIVEAIDDATDDDDSTYISSSTIGDKFFVGVPALPASASTVRAVKASIIARKEGAENVSFVSKVKSGSTEAVGASGGLATGYQGFAYLSETDPATGVAWTISGANALKVGGELA